MITCYLSYVIDPGKLAEFEHYARLWISLVEKFGGTHHGYFVPTEGPASTEFSFPEIGGPGPGNIAVALFSFPGVTEYERYRQKAAEDAECQAATEYFKKTNCFLKYERSFMRRVSQ